MKDTPTIYIDPYGLWTSCTANPINAANCSGSALPVPRPIPPVPVPVPMPRNPDDDRDKPLPAPAIPQDGDCGDEPPDCRKATNWELEQAGIRGREHEYKREHGAIPESKFDICKCTDGIFRIAPVKQCGRTRNFWR